MAMVSRWRVPAARECMGSEPIGKFVSSGKAGSGPSIWRSRRPWYPACLCAPNRH